MLYRAEYRGKQQLSVLDHHRPASKVNASEIEGVAAKWVNNGLYAECSSTDYKIDAANIGAATQVTSLVRLTLFDNPYVDFARELLLHKRYMPMCCWDFVLIATGALEMYPKQALTLLLQERPFQTSQFKLMSYEEMPDVSIFCYTDSANTIWHIGLQFKRNGLLRRYDMMPSTDSSGVEHIDIASSNAESDPIMRISDLYQHLEGLETGQDHHVLTPQDKMVIATAFYRVLWDGALIDNINDDTAIDYLKHEPGSKFIPEEHKLKIAQRVIVVKIKDEFAKLMHDEIARALFTGDMSIFAPGTRKKTVPLKSNDTFSVSYHIREDLGVYWIHIRTVET